jgi:hypothetical protein
MARKPAGTRDSTRGVVWMQGLACGACAAIAPAACWMLVVLLAPTIGALVLDRAPGRPVARAVLLCGAPACVNPLIALWQAGTDTGLALLSDTGVLGVAWAAGASGWLLSQLLPIGIRGILEAASLTRTARLRAERERLLKAWGLDDQ